MGKFEYKYVETILSENTKVPVADVHHDLAEPALNHLGNAGWKLISTTQRQGSTVAWIFRRKIKRD